MDKAKFGVWEIRTFYMLSTPRAHTQSPASYYATLPILYSIDEKKKIRGRKVRVWYHVASKNNMHLTCIHFYLYTLNITTSLTDLFHGRLYAILSQGETRSPRAGLTHSHLGIICGRSCSRRSDMSGVVLWLCLLGLPRLAFACKCRVLEFVIRRASWVGVHVWKFMLHV